jgi:hypothetical protein
MFSEYLDDVFAPFGKKAGISGHDMSLIWTPQILATVIQVPVNLFSTELGAKIIDLVLGVAGGLAIGFGAVKGKAAAELSEMVSYWITNLYVPQYAQTGISAQISSLAAGIKSGNMSQIQAALFTNQAAAKAELDSYLSIFNPATYSAPSASIRPAISTNVVASPTSPQTINKPTAKAYIPAAINESQVSSVRKPVQVYS